ncbi:MAG: hypothetical protein RLZZ546_1829 [Bacteroidota bacterium]|jgi:hypothetical protein
MKVSKFLLIALFTFTVSFLSANDIDPKAKTKLREEVSKLLSGVEWDKSSETIMISFILTSNNEVVVTTTNNPKYEEIIKSKLNYKKVNVCDVKPYEVFTLPISVKEHK